MNHQEAIGIPPAPSKKKGCFTASSAVIRLAGSYCNILLKRSTPLASNVGTNPAKPFGGGGYIGKFVG
jgi:hypothetical protein